MIIAQPSNFVTAVYVVICDLLLPITLTWLVGCFLSSRNVKCIYKERRRVSLTSTRLSFFAHQGITEKGIRTAMALLSTTIVSLSIAGSFSISGFSRKKTETVQAEVLVGLSSSRDVIDYTQHVSENGSLVSGTFLLAKDAVRCMASKEGEILQYATTNTLHDLTRLKWSGTSDLNNSTCLMEEFGFVENFSTRYQLLSVNNHTTCNLRIEVDSSVKLRKSTAHIRKPCPFEVHEFWCSSYAFKFCAGLLEYQEGFRAIAFKYHKATVPATTVKHSGSLRVVGAFSQNALHEKSIRSMAYLLGTGAVTYPSPLGRALVGLSIKTNVNIEKNDGTVEETEINIPFLASTLGTALFLTFALAGAAYISWKRNVSMSGLRGCNSFYSAHDMLMCAVHAASKDGMSNRTEGVTVCVSRKDPHVGPLLQSEDEGTHSFPEEELEGLLSCDRNFPKPSTSYGNVDII